MTGAAPVTVLALVPIHSIIIVQVYVVFIINDLMYNNYYNYATLYTVIIIHNFIYIISETVCVYIQNVIYVMILIIE